MVEKSEFKDHAELGKDSEILSSLDKARNGKTNRCIKFLLNIM
jgi:hypothetical protein